jgi:AAA domain, putative AbiEii toxin, Type IV TA system/AAA ATPase domain
MAITLQGFKSFRDETTIEIRPLTLLAGANSSGKSSAIQPLLLLKQTLEATRDPGPLWLGGPNVKFTSVDQLLWRGQAEKDHATTVSIGLSCATDAGDEHVRLFFRRAEQGGVELERLAYQRADLSYELRPDMRGSELHRIFQKQKSFFKDIDREPFSFRVQQARSSLAAVAQYEQAIGGGTTYTMAPFDTVSPVVHDLVHLPGLRGNPERSYPTARVDVRFPALFQDYVASVMLAWKETADSRLEKLDRAIHDLGLTWKVDARRLDDTSIEIRVGRMPSLQKGGAHDLVNIADVGFGVSQTLPVVVALLTAAPGQVVYLEQPEIHLHPRAQVALAGLLVDAAKRGVLVIAETHSSLLLVSVQRAVAAGEIDPSLVALHWFERDKRGATKVTKAELDAAGTYGDWPEDFGDVELKLESAFLDASLFRRPA